MIDSILKNYLAKRRDYGKLNTYLTYTPFNMLGKEGEKEKY